MGLWIAILITLVVMGSILWIKPSPRERLLTEYRKAALAKGLKVRLLDAKLAGQLFPWIENYRQYVFYEKTLPVFAKPKSHKARVIRLSVDPGAHEIDIIDPLRQIIISNPGFLMLTKTAEALVISASGIALLWREGIVNEEDKLKPVDLIEQFLDECTQHSKMWV